MPPFIPPAASGSKRTMGRLLPNGSTGSTGHVADPRLAHTPSFGHPHQRRRRGGVPSSSGLRLGSPLPAVETLVLSSFLRSATAPRTQAFFFEPLLPTKLKSMLGHFAKNAFKKRSKDLESSGDPEFIPLLIALRVAREPLAASTVLVLAARLDLPPRKGIVISGRRMGRWGFRALAVWP